MTKQIVTRWFKRDEAKRRVVQSRVYATEQPPGLLHYSGGPFDGDWDTGMVVLPIGGTGRWVIDDLYGAVQKGRRR